MPAIDIGGGNNYQAPFREWGKIMTVERILVTGATGFLGRHTLPVLRRHFGADRVVGVSSRDYDLLDRGQVDRMLAEIRPDVIVHYAAYCGGNLSNMQFPADFYYRNTMFVANVFDAAARAGVKKIVYPMGGCSYPADAVSPIGEDQLWRGYPQKESAAYSTAKMMGAVAAKAYKTQFGMNAAILIPGNMYGEYDNFNALAGHVVSGMIRRYLEARLSGAAEVVMWGSGRPTRDFVYAGDVAATIPFFIEGVEECDPVNVSSGRQTSIKELAEIIAGLTGFQGEIRWDTEKPEGQLDKSFRIDRLRALGLGCPTPLQEGLARTIAWFTANYANQGDGLRL